MCLNFLLYFDQVPKPASQYIQVYLVIHYNCFILQGRKKTLYLANRAADNSRGQKNDNMNLEF